MRKWGNREIHKADLTLCRDFLHLLTIQVQLMLQSMDQQL